MAMKFVGRRGGRVILDEHREEIQPGPAERILVVPRVWSGRYADAALSPDNLAALKRVNHTINHVITWAATESRPLIQSFSDWLKVFIVVQEGRDVQQPAVEVGVAGPGIAAAANADYAALAAQIGAAFDAPNRPPPRPKAAVAPPRRPAIMPQQRNLDDLWPAQNPRVENPPVRIRAYYEEPLGEQGE